MMLVFVLTCILCLSMFFMTTTNIIYLWVGLVLLTFMSIHFLNILNIYDLSDYYLLQELSSLFLIVTLLESWTSLAFLLLLVKGGVAPFHFWVLKLFMHMHLESFCNMMTLMKIPMLVLVIKSFNSNHMLILILGYVMLSLQITKVTNITLFVILSSNLSLNMILMSAEFSEIMSIMLVILYQLSMYLLLKELLFFYKEHVMTVLMIWLINFPLVFTLMVKLTFMYTVMSFMFILLLLLLSLVCQTVPLSNLLTTEELTFLGQEQSYTKTTPLTSIFVINLLLDLLI